MPRSTIYKQKRKVFAFSSVPLCLFLFFPTFPKIILRCLKNSNEKCKGDMRKNNSSKSIQKRQQNSATLSILLRRQRRQQKSRLERKLKREGLQRRIRRKNEQSISSNSRTKYWQKMLLFQKESTKESQIVGSKYKVISENKEK